MAKKDYEHEIIQHYGTFTERPSGWTREVNLISWNEGEPKIDIRDWAPGYIKAGKGITLTIGEARAVAHIILEIEE